MSEQERINAEIARHNAESAVQAWKIAEGKVISLTTENTALREEKKRLESRIARLEAMKDAGDELFYAILRYWDSHSPENRERVSIAISGYECALSELEEKDG